MQNSVWQSLPLNGSATKEKKAIDTCGYNKQPVDSHGSPSCVWSWLWLHPLPQPQIHQLQSLPRHHHLTVTTSIKTPHHQQYGVFTSPNSLSPPHFPLPAPNSSLKSMQTASPAFQKWPYLALISTAPWFDDPLLNGLSLKSPKLLEIVKQSTISYHLNKNMISAWSEVENQLLYLIKILLKYRICFCNEENPL